MPPPATPPKPPAWKGKEKRPHLLEVELDELILFPEADHEHLKPGWFESLTYCISLHPHSENHEDIPLPREAPRATLDGEHLVSQTQKPKQPEVQVGRMAKTRASEGDGSLGDDKAYHPHVQFREQLALHLSQLDENLVAYVWGRKASMTSESVTLIGRAMAPLHDFSLQRRSTTWGIFDVAEGFRVAEMRLKYWVATTPSAVQEARLTDATRTEVTINWEPPANDHGAPIVGFKISIQLDAKQGAGLQWFTLCECTKSLKPVYVVANLTGNTQYQVDVRAVNKVGTGDPCEFQVSTAPVEPDPPSKPWVEESRDGCLNMAWKASPADGGYPITAYKIRMRKLLGATSFNQWHGMGPKEHQSSWVEMGTVGAAMGDEAEPTVYSAWVGPLEKESCEYRFQIFALNRAGESKGSELSEAQYT